MDKIIFLHNLKEKKLLEGRDGLSILKITIDNIHQNESLVVKSIHLFSKEIEWDNMWTIKNCYDRLGSGNILFVLCYKDNPIGHVWYDNSNLFNAFVSRERFDGDSMWFIQETMWMMKDSYNLNEIKLWTDNWNTRAQKFWIKLGYVKI